MKQNLPHTKAFRLYILSVLLSMLIFFDLHAQSFPANFSMVTVASGMSNSIVMDFAPDGRIFVGQQGGSVRVIKNGQLLSTPFTTVSVDFNAERGLIGLVLDPNFATNGYVYIQYTTNTGSGIKNRISRFTANGDVALAGSKVDILTLESLGEPRHNGGALKFKDGKLYVAVGDNFVSGTAQNLDTYKGKILRINPDGTPAAGNPFPTGSVQRRSVWAYGIRNPFTFDVDKVSGKIFVNDVGPETREEINDVTNGGNFGWPTVTHGSTDPRFKAAIYSYQRTAGAGSSTQGCAISGGTFLTASNNNYPSQYKNKYYYVDFCSSWINYIDPSTGSRTYFGSFGGDGVLNIDVGNDGNLYFLRKDGILYKIVYTNNQCPAFTNQPESVSVTEGQPASFTVSVSGATPFTYQWQKNGVNISGANSATYTIPSVAPSDAGQYRVVVTNSCGTLTSNSATLTVLPFNAAPEAQILTPSTTLTYGGGQTISFSGTATDPEDGTLPASAFTWRVDNHHNTHVHPGPAVSAGVKSGSFTVSIIGEEEASVWIRIYLTVTDSKGLTNTKFVEVFPRKSTVNLTTQPAGLKVTLNGTPRVTPYSYLGVEGLQHDLDADQFQTLNGVTYKFSHWQHGGQQAQSFLTPANDTTFTAVFVESPTINLAPSKDAYVKDGANATTNYGATDATKLESKDNGAVNSGFSREAYLGFDLSTASGNFESVILKVYGNLSSAGSAIPVGIYSVANTTWSETTINWNNKPASGTSALATTSITDVTPKYYTWDVTNYVKAEKAAGRNLITFRLKNNAVSAPQIVWNSKETGTNAPQLEITLGEVVDPQQPFGGTVRAIPGKIEAEHYDEGGQGIAYSDATTGNTPAAFRTDDVDLEPTTDTGGGYNTSYSAPGEWLEYTVNVTTAGVYSFQVRVASIYSGKTLHIEMNGVNVTGSIMVPNTGGWQTWQTVTVPNISLTAGQKIMRIAVETDRININYVNVTLTSSAREISLVENTGTSMYPNPADKVVTITTDVETISNVSISVYSLTESLLLQKEFTNVKGRFEQSVDISSLPAGTYIIQLRTGNTTESKTLIKK